MSFLSIVMVSGVFLTHLIPAYIDVVGPIATMSDGASSFSIYTPTPLGTIKFLRDDLSCNIHAGASSRASCGSFQHYI